MGWSCRKDAMDTMNAWAEACYKQSGISNLWRENGREYFFEHSRTEHADGAITGTIWPRGSFRIEGNGEVSRAPKFLKSIVVN